MPEVLLRAPLSEMCGGRRHAAAGATVREALVSLEREHPSLRGWILDEQGRIREHIQIFVNGTHGEDNTPIGATDRIHVLPAITGG